MFSFFLTPKIVIGLEDKCLGLLSKMESTKTIYHQLCDKYMKKIPICHFCVGVYYLGDGPEGHFLWHLARWVTLLLALVSTMYIIPSSLPLGDKRSKNMRNFQTIFGVLVHLRMSSGGFSHWAKIVKIGLVIH